MHGPTKTEGTVRWKALAIVLMTVMGLFAVAWGIDGQLLASQTTVGVVAAKEHHEMRKTYVMDKIGNVNRMVPRVIPEEFILKLRIGSGEISCPVDSDLYRAAKEGQEMDVVFEKRRITGSINVISVKARS